MVTLKVSLNCFRRPTVMTESIPSSERGRWVSTSSGEDRRRTDATSALIVASRRFLRSAEFDGAVVTGADSSSSSLSSSSLSESTSGGGRRAAISVRIGTAGVAPSSIGRERTTTTRGTSYLAAYSQARNASSRVTPVMPLVSISALIKSAEAEADIP